MANKQHLDILKRSVDAWNEWRQENPSLSPDLARADLSQADLAVANLVGCRMLGVDLVGANLRSADLRTAKDLTQEQINETSGDADTNLPEGLEQPKDWALETDHE